MTRPPTTVPTMPFAKYRPTLPLVLEDRTWASRQLTKAPLWCSVDLRDGNQALVDPMGPERKLALFQTLVAVGIKEIEVGFPSASAPDFDFVRQIIEGDLVPDDVTLQVLTQCRRDLIERTFEALQGARSAIVHFYNSTSELQRRVVFRQGKEGIVAIATGAARACRELEPALAGTALRYEYSPESFTGTEPDFALAICKAVAEVIEPTADKPLVLNLPSTVEVYTPNVFADVVEWFGRHLKDRQSIVLSVHPHNDRGTAVAAAEMAMLAGADRLEGTLLGNGERTGNLDLVTVALNLMSQGVDPGLCLQDVDAVRRVVEHATRMPVHPRHPYVGDLVYTAFSGSHQDAIKKGMDALPVDYHTWEVPYLPIDPKHVGRTYEAIIRVNSQSGKGGVAYVMGAEHGLDLPRSLQVELSKAVQAVTETTGTEIKPAEIWGVFEKTYLDQGAGLRLLGTEVSTERATGAHVTVLTAQLLVDGTPTTIVGRGNGPIDALVDGLGQTGLKLAVLDYHQHALTSGSEASSVAYVQAQSEDGSAWGVGMDSSILDASLQAVVSAANRLRSTAQVAGEAGAA